MRKRKRHKTHILVLEKDDPEKELEFELDFQGSLTVAERFRMMFEHSREAAKRVKRDGRRKTASVLKRS
jgi:hypothetical protein